MNYFQFCYTVGQVAICTTLTALILLGCGRVCLFVLEQSKQALERFERFLGGDRS